MAGYGPNSKMALLGQNSPATTYLLSVLEKKTREGVFPTGVNAVSRVNSAFASLVEILPHCGMYSPVLKLIKEELYTAVYSEMVTTAQTNVSKSGKEKTTTEVPKLERVPYFVLLKRLEGNQNETAEGLRSQISDLRERLKESHGEIGKKDELTESLRQNVSELQMQLAEVQRELEGKKSEIERLEIKIIQMEEDSEEKESGLLDELSQVLGKKQQLQDENYSLRPYKLSYDTLKDTFDLPPEKRPRRGFRRPILATKKTQLLSSIEAASKLEQQILEVQNKTLEEYDKHLEEVKGKLSGKRLADNSSDPNYFNEELQLENLGDEMTARQHNFQRLVSGMVVEFELVRAHREALQSELLQLEQVEMGTRAMADGDGSTGGTIPPSSLAGGRPGSSRMMLLDDGKKNGRDSRLSLGDSGLEEDNTKLTDPSTDPFNPQERVMSKYSAMLYTSVNGGKSFDEVSSAKFCISCGEKTTICPHKVTKEDMILRLPRGCSHIKVSRPQVRIAVSLSQQGAPQTASTMYPGRPGADTWLSTRPEPHGWDASGDWIQEEETRQQLAMIWDDFKTRTGMERFTLLPVSRDLPHVRILSLIEQLYASIIWQDDHPPVDDEELGTMKDYLYNFISERYQEDEITPLATFDFLTGVIKYASQDKMILVFGQVMAGNVDGSVARYIHLVADLIDIVNWEEVKDFAGYAEALYPFLHEDDVDQIVVEYTAFSENKISKSLLMDYLIHTVLKNKEPRIQDIEGQLSSIQVNNAGHMTVSEFVGAMESLAPLANEKLWRKLMKESFLSHKDGEVSITNLASIAAYVSLLQVIPLLREQLPGKIERAREMRRNEVSSKLEGVSQKVSETGKLITINQVKQLAFNVSRQRQASVRQTQNAFDDFEWHSRPNTQDSIE